MAVTLHTEFHVHSLDVTCNEWVKQLNC